MTEVKIISKETLTTIEVKATASMLGIIKIIPATFRELIEFMDKNNVKPEAAPYVYYYEVNWDELSKEGKLMGFIRMFTRKWKIAIGYPTNREMQTEGKYLSGKINGGKYLSAIHIGPYQKINDCYKQILEYAANQKLKIKNESVEFYLNDPKTTKQEELETEVLIPLE